MIIPNEDKGLGKRRHAMPQIKDFDAFIKDLEDNGIAVETLSIPPGELKPTQGNFNEQKVKGMIENGSWSSKPIVSSDDDFVLDGHHRWLSAAQVNKPIRSRVIGMPIEELLDFVKGKPYVETRDLNESKATDLQRIQDYYARIARTDGGQVLADVLNRVNTLRQLVQDNPDSVRKSRAMISQYLNKIEELIRG